MARDLDTRQTDTRLGIRPVTDDGWLKQ